MTDVASPSRSACSRALPAALLLVAFAAGAANVAPIAVPSIEGRGGDARTARAMAAAVAVALDLLVTERSAPVLANTILDTAGSTCPAACPRPLDVPLFRPCPLAERLLDLPPPARA